VLPERSMILVGSARSLLFLTMRWMIRLNLVFYQCLSGMRLEPVDLFGSSTG